MLRDLCDLPRCDQRTDGDESSVARRESRTKPKVKKEQVGCVLNEPRRE
jgi:hypothetical protein